MIHRRLGNTIPLLLLLASAACGGDATGAADAAPQTLEISGPRTLEVGQSIALSAALKDAAGGSQAAGSVSWSSSDPSLIDVTGDGTVKAARIGSVTITASAAGKQATANVTSSLTPYTFVFPSGVPAADQQVIRDGVQYAHAFEGTAVGRSIQKPTTVTGALSDPGCASGGAAAFTGPGGVTFCIGNPGWTSQGPLMKQKIVQHELFHVWQFEYGWLTNADRAGPTWIIEGSAELMGFRGLDARNTFSFATAIGCQVKESTDFAATRPPGLPPLQTVECVRHFRTRSGPCTPTPCWRWTSSPAREG